VADAETEEAAAVEDVVAIEAVAEEVDLVPQENEQYDAP